ncbi:2220_t:CDS:2, partial [Gigaspora rosea]
PKHKSICQEIGRIEEAKLIHPSNIEQAHETRQDSYPLARINKLLGALKGLVQYTTLDLAREFWQTKILFLGHEILEQSITVAESKVAA